METATDRKPWLVTVSFLFAASSVGGKQAIDDIQREVKRLAERHGVEIVGGSTKWSSMTELVRFDLAHDEPTADPHDPETGERRDMVAEQFAAGDITLNQAIALDAANEAEMRRRPATPAEREAMGIGQVKTFSPDELAEMGIDVAPPTPNPEQPAPRRAGG